MQIYMLKTCDTCREALRKLRAAGYDPKITDVRADGVSVDDLARFFADLGEDLVNRRSKTWRDLSEADRRPPALDLLASHPTLMKRPVIEVDGKLYLGFGDDVQTALLG
jgi:arsenate reductase